MARLKGRPPQGLTESIRLVLTPEDYQLVRKLAEERNDTAQEMIRIAIRKTYRPSEVA